MTKAKYFYVLNSLARMVTLGGVPMVPGQISKIPDVETNRDDADMDGLKIVSKEGAEEETETLETDDVLHPNSQTDAEATAKATEANSAKKAGWNSPKATPK